VHKVFEAGVLGLHFDRNSAAEGKSPACGRARDSLHLILSAVSMILTKPKPTYTAEGVILFREQLSLDGCTMPLQRQLTRGFALV
jgi:hypothetical protein